MIPAGWQKAGTRWCRSLDGRSRHSSSAPGCWSPTGGNRVLRCRDELAEENALTLIRGSVGDFSVKSKTVGKDGIELTAELRIKEQSTDFVNRLCEPDGVDSAVLVSYNGDYLS